MADNKDWRAELEELRRLDELEKKFNPEQVTPFKFKPRQNIAVMPEQGEKQGWAPGDENAFPPQARPKGSKIYQMLPMNLYKAAQAGVDIDSGAPTGNFNASFAGTEAEKADAYSSALEKKLGYRPEVRFGPESASGEVEYKPKGGRWTTVSGRKVNFGSMAGGAVEGAIQTAGAVAGAITGGPAGSVVGAGAGGYVGQTARNAIGRGLGVIGPEVPVTTGATADAGSAALAEAVGQGAVGAWRLGKWWFKGRTTFTPEEATFLVGEQAKYDKIIKDIETKSGEKFSPNTAQLALRGSPESRTTQKAGQLWTQAAGDTNSVGVDIRAQDAQNTLALKTYFTKVLEQERQKQIPKEQAGKQVNEAVIDPYKTALAAAKQKISELPANVQENETGTIVRGALEAAKDDFKNKIEDPAWNAFRSSIGFDPSTFTSKVRVPWSRGVRNLMAQWTSEEKQAILNLAQRDTEGLKVIFKEKPDVFSNVLDAKGNKILLEKGGPVPDEDLATINDTVQWLGRNLRTKLVGKTGVQIDSKAISDLHRELKAMQDGYLAAERPDIMKNLQAARDATSQKYNKYNTGLSGAMLTYGKGGELKLSDSESVYRILRDRDPASVAQLAENIKSTPEAKTELNNYLLALYRRDYTKQGMGIPDRRLHAKFLEDYGDVIKNFFRPEDAVQVTRLGGLAETVLKEYKEAKNILPRVKGILGDDIEIMDSNAIINGVLTGRITSDKMSKALGVINKDYTYGKDVISSWKSAAAEELYGRIMKNGEINYNTLNSVVEGDQGKVLVKLFNAGSESGRSDGEVLMQGLKMLRDAAQISRLRPPTGLSPEQSTVFTEFLRAGPASPLSREGRLVTLGQKLRGRYEPVSIYKALYDRDEMTRLVQRGYQIKAWTRGVAAGASIYDSIE